MNYLSISKMAEIHNISRQTLIFYDKIGLFCPIKTDEKGYRYYSPYQIPFLREICFLKNAGIKLEVIRDHIRNRNTNTAISLLESHREQMDKEIEQLIEARNVIEKRIQVYKSINSYRGDLYKPYIDTYPERQVVFIPYNEKVEKRTLHLTLMKAWSVLIEQNCPLSEGFGTILKKDSIETEDPLAGSGVYAVVPAGHPKIKTSIAIPAGEYACMYKYGMPYDLKFLNDLLQWIKDNNYRVIGDIVDACLLDTTFYTNESSVDLCHLQIPVEKIS